MKTYTKEEIDNFMKAYAKIREIANPMLRSFIDASLRLSPPEEIMETWACLWGLRKDKAEERVK